LWDQLSPEKVREVVEQKFADDARQKAQAAAPREIQKFFQMHPEYVDCDNNSAVMKVGFKTLGLDGTIVTAEQCCDVFDRNKELLQLKQHVVNGQLRQEIRDEIQAEREAAAFDEDNAYAMPLNELARRARGW